MNREYFKAMKPVEINVVSVDSLLEMYESDTFIVNRDYQRKLVWSLEEKVKLIDTILNGYTVPMFMFGMSFDSGKEQLEIIDGLQRLDAIFSFIFNEYYIVQDGQKMYFDLDSHYVTLGLKENGRIMQKYPIMPKQLCTKFKAYKLAFSVTKAPKDVIEETFRRVNSSGRRLSSQDLRQAGTSNNFSKLVNRIAMEIRRDVSSDHLLQLDAVKKISISNHGLPYGINVNSVFWVRQGIITPENIRDSRDEELVARILGRAVLGKAIGNSASTLDSLYSESSSMALNFDRKLHEMGDPGLIIQNIVSITELFADVFKEHTFSNILERDGDTKVEGKRNIFLIIVLMLYDKIFEEGKRLVNAEAMVSIIQNSYGVGARNYKILNGTFNRDIRERLVHDLSESVDACFSQISSNEEAWQFINTDIKEFECLVHDASLERQMLDYKISACSLADGTFNDDCLHKIVKTLTAMSNTDLSHPGFVVLGVADSEDDAKKYEKLFHVEASNYAGLFITGIDGEANGDLDGYVRKLQQKIENEPVLPSVSAAICRNFKVLNYYGHTIIIFTLKSDGVPISYDNKFFERHGTSVCEIPIGSEEFNAFFRRCSAGCEAGAISAF